MRVPLDLLVPLVLLAQEDERVFEESAEKLVSLDPVVYRVQLVPRALKEAKATKVNLEKKVVPELEVYLAQPDQAVPEEALDHQVLPVGQD